MSFNVVFNETLDLYTKCLKIIQFRFVSHDVIFYKTLVIENPPNQFIVAVCTNVMLIVKYLNTNKVYYQLSRIKQEKHLKKKHHKSETKKIRSRKI